jgi:Bifunctional DNA primase/polymerase, N-terminal
MHFLEAALDLTAFGWKVFPLAPWSKEPAISKDAGGRGCHDASDDADAIAEWGHRYPRANIGIATGEPSGILVIDLDPRNGSEETVAKLASKKQTFSATVQVRTWSGGTHLYYAWQSGIINSKSKLGRGIDVKTTGGYVVAPPSKVRCKETRKTAGYVWVRSPLGEYLPRLPQWAVEALKPKPQPIMPRSSVQAPKDIAPLVKFVAGAPEGQRNNSLYWAACRAAEAGTLGQSEAAAFLDAALAAGLERDKAAKTIASALRRGKVA